MNEKSATITTVPAVAGWYMRYFIKGNTDYPAYLSHEPIVAWEIERVESSYYPIAKRPAWDRIVSRYTYPILLSGECSNAYVVQDPSGKLHEPEGPTFDTEAEAIAYFVQQEADDSARPTGNGVAYPTENTQATSDG